MQSGELLPLDEVNETSPSDNVLLITLQSAEDS